MIIDDYTDRPILDYLRGIGHNLSPQVQYIKFNVGNFKSLSFKFSAGKCIQ